MSGVRAMENTYHPLLNGPEGISVNLEWLRRGLAMFLWASGRSLASLHQSAALSMGNGQKATEGRRFRLAGSFVQYVFERQGMDRLRRFFRRAEKVGIEPAARGVFGRGFLELAEEWESMLKSLER